MVPNENFNPFAVLHKKLIVWMFMRNAGIRGYCLLLLTQTGHCQSKVPLTLFYIRLEDVLFSKGLHLSLVAVCVGT